MIRCYITDRLSLRGDLLENIERQAKNGIDYIQIREKDLSARELLELTRAAIARVEGTSCKLLVNERTDVALAAGAHGVHLRSTPIPPEVWRRIVPEDFVIGVSCHTQSDVIEAAGAALLLFGPVFATAGKGDPVGLDALRAVAKLTTVPVLALGGITPDNAQSCIEAGARGIAAIRMFQK